MKIAALFNAEHHPICLSPNADNSLSALFAYIEQHRTELNTQMQRHGGLLFRGFDVADAKAFADVSTALGGQAGSYVGGNSPRTRLMQDVYTSTEFPASESISLHNEMSYLPHWPKRLFFYSLIPAATGGQTSLAHSLDILQQLPAEIVETFRSKKICYIRNFQAKAKMGKSWQATYQTDSREEVEEAILAQGSTFEWRDDGGLRVSTICDATTLHPDTGQELWFNQAEQWHPSAMPAALRKMFEDAFGIGQLAHHCTFADGSPIDEAMLAEIRRCMQANKLLFDWQKGDVLMIDNLLLMHGREAFKGERKTLVFLSEV